ncbi:MAG: hypothetical protein KGL39_58870 [Patescibacteria group bacterium]|nr:hypothetical protein [Patescibacteria group bacterium]
MADLLYLGEPGQQPLKVRRGIDCYFDISLADGQKILSSTADTPILIVATAHGFSNGDNVEVNGHQVNTTANGRRVVTVVDADRVTLNGTVGIATGGQTGTIGKLFDFTSRTQKGQVRVAKDVGSLLLLDLAVSNPDQYTVRITFPGAATKGIAQRQGYFDVVSMAIGDDQLIVEGAIEFDGIVTDTGA